MKNNRKIRLGVLGLGHMGTKHVRNILEGKCPEIEVTAVADLLEERLNWARSVLPDVQTFTDGSEMISSGDCEAILICVPHYLHPEYAILGLRAGLHVMTEKPAGVYTLQAEEMNRAAEESDRVFGIMYNQRTNCIYRRMREIVQSGEMGEIRRTNWIITDWYRPQKYYDSGTWRATWRGEGGGLLLNQCPHNLDLWQWICGMPEKVTAFAHFGKWHNIEVEDDVTAYVEYPNGATGVFVASTGDAPGTNRFEIDLEMGKLVAENGKLYRWQNAMPLDEFERETRKIHAKPACAYTEVETDGKNPQHVGVLNAFAGAILRGEPLVADGREGIRGLSLSNAMLLSGWLGTAVRLPIDAKLYYEELKKRISASTRRSTDYFDFNAADYDI